MPLEISPEPTPQEREVLLRALTALDPPPQGASAWWEAGVREAVEEEPGELRPAATDGRASPSSASGRAGNAAPASSSPPAA